jgi:hypothetical protein
MRSLPALRQNSAPLERFAPQFFNGGLRRCNSRQIVERETCSPLASTISPKIFIPGEGIFNSITIYCMEGSRLSETGVAWKGR